MDQSVEPGTRWRLRRGEHTGSIIEVEGRTFAGAVKYRGIEGGRSVGSSSEDDNGRYHSRRLAEFLLMYEPVAKDAGTGEMQAAFRQRNARKPKPVTNGTAISAPAEGLQVTLETITPMLAKEWLARGGTNRHFDQKRAGRIVAAIRRGEWHITGDTIKRDSDGYIRDGQHRLWAIAEAGITVQTLVVRNVSEPAFDVMDTGKSRTLPDVLSLHGIPSINGTAAAVRNLMLFEHSGRFVVTTRESSELVTTASGLAYALQHPEVNDALHTAEVIRKVMPGGIGLWTALLVLFRRVNQEAADAFVESLLNGEGLLKGSPILVVRNRLLPGQVIVHTQQEKEILAAALIKAWNAYRKSKTVDGWGRLQWRYSGPNAEPFPRPDDN